MKNKFLFLLLIVLVCSCQKNNSNKQTLKLNFQVGDIPTLNPHQLSFSMRGKCLGKWLFEGLTRINCEGEPELAGAEEVFISPSQTQYTFILRPQKWSNGTQLTAYDYEYAWKEAIRPNADSPQADLFYVIKNAKSAKLSQQTLDEVGVKALDEKTLLVELSHPAPYFLELLSHPLFVPMKKEDQTLLFNGPFIVDQWKKGKQITLKANPAFWDAENIKLERIDIFTITDSMTALALYEKGELDWVGEPLSPLPFESIISLKNGKDLHKEVVVRPYWLSLNTQKPPLTSPSIRQALSTAIDRKEIAEHILCEDTPLYTPLPISMSLCPETLVDDEITLAQTLFQKGLEELCQESIPPLTISYCTLPGRKQLAEYLQEKWENTFGITVQLEGIEWNVFYERLKKGQYQIGGYSENTAYNDPSELLERFSQYHFSQWSEAEYQEKIYQAKNTVDLEKRKEFLAAAEKELKDSMPIIPITNRTHTYATRPNFKGYVFDHVGCVDFRWAYFE